MGLVSGIRLYLAVLLVLFGSLALQPLYLPQSFGWPMIVGGLAVCLLWVTDQGIAHFAKRAMFGGGKYEAFPKSYFEGTRFVVNALIVVSGVALGLVKDWVFPAKTLVLIALGVVILLGFIHFNVFSGGLISEYTTVETRNAQSITASYVELHTLNMNVSILLLNLQFAALFVALAALAIDSLR
jgi:hypothetical protein